MSCLILTVKKLAEELMVMYIKPGGETGVFLAS